MPAEDLEAIIRTSKGTIKVRLYATKMPMTVANFVNLSQRDYYDGLIFHFVDPGYIVQGGDPTGTGKGGPNYFVPAEHHPDAKHDKEGILSMAQKEPPNTTGSQFFITLGPAPHLDGMYPAFGEVTGGMEVVRELRIGDEIKDVEIQGSTEALFAHQEDNLKFWNRKLDQQR